MTIASTTTVVINDFVNTSMESPLDPNQETVSVRHVANRWQTDQWLRGTYLGCRRVD